MIFRITQWSLQVMENGTRRLDVDLLPLTDNVVEQVGASGSQRCFVADPDGGEFAKLKERLASQGAVQPHAQVLSATLYDGLAHSPTRVYAHYECGAADFVDIDARVTSNAMDELLRQDSLKHPVFYVEFAIDGMKRTTEANSEGQLIDTRWVLTNGVDGGKSRVLGIQFHYPPSVVYEQKESAPLLPTRDDILSIGGLIQRQIAISERIRAYATISCIIAALVLALVWSRQ